MFDGDCDAVEQVFVCTTESHVRKWHRTANSCLIISYDAFKRFTEPVVAAKKAKKGGKMNRWQAKRALAGEGD